MHIRYEENWYESTRDIQVLQDDSFDCSQYYRSARKKNSYALKAKRGLKLYLTKCSLRIFRNYVINNRFDPLYVVVAKLSSTVRVLIGAKLKSCI